MLTSQGVQHTCQVSTLDGGLVVDLLIQQPAQQIVLSIETFVRRGEHMLLGFCLVCCFLKRGCAGQGQAGQGAGLAAGGHL